MTWHQGRGLAVVSAALCLSAAVGCGSSSNNATIEITAPEKGATLTLKNDDSDPNTPGLQYDVKATSTGVATGTGVLLTIEADAGDASSGTVNTATVGKDGTIQFDAVTLPPGMHALKVATTTGNVQSADDYTYTYKSLDIVSPRDGAMIGKADDKDMMTDGIQINVSVSTTAIDPSDDVTLQVDGVTVGDPQHPDQDMVVFSGVTLDTGTHTLKAISGGAESSVVHVSVNTACAVASFVTPAPPADGDKLTLGGGSMCPMGMDPFTVDVLVSTDAVEGSSIDLMVNGTIKASAKVSGAQAKFSGVVLDNRGSANTLAVVAQSAQGMTCDAIKFPADIYVDCAGADCSIGSPSPHSGVDATGQPALYLNKSLENGSGFDIQVNTDSTALGHPVQLIIDGDDRHAMMVDPMQADNKVTALFQGVSLTEGKHTVEARCDDLAGNTTYSGEATWIVDTQACGVDITDPAADTAYVPGDDTDSHLSGTQVKVTSDITGSDCSDTRAAPCTLSDGIQSGSFDAFDGKSPLTSSVTLGSAATQTLCVEVQDRAGNVGRAGVDVKYDSAAPQLKIESPTENTSFNAAGDGSHTADSDPSTPDVCNANFSVACSEVGKPVDLHRGDTTSTPIATATCTAPGSGDPALPSGFAGRATFSNVELFASGQTSAKIYATQAITGSSNKTNVGSDSVDVTGYCTIPSLTLVGGCPNAELGIPAGGGDVMPTQLQPPVVMYSGGSTDQAPMTATLTVHGSVSGDQTPQMADISNGQYTFTNVNYGHDAEDVTLTIDAKDSFGNDKTLTCMSTLANDMPTLTITSPSDGQNFGLSAGCNTGMANTYGVPIQVTVDKTMGRSLTYAVGSGSSTPVAITGSNTSFCVPVDEGMQNIKVRLTSTLTNGYDEKMISVHVSTVTIQAPSANMLLTAAWDYCDATNFGAHVQAATDPVHFGQNATVSNGTNSVMTTVSNSGVIDTCLVLPDGPNTIIVSIDGTNASASVMVTVDVNAPTHAIPITAATLPTSSDSSYRTENVHLTWNAPTQDYQNQLSSYQLKCATTPVMASDTQQNKDNWWNNTAVDVALPNNFVVSSTSVDLPLRTGEALNCVLRGKDQADQLTPIPDSTAIDKAFRTQAVTTSDTNRMGATVSRVGDVNGDGVPDILVGGADRAYLYFGSANGISSKSSPDVTFIADHSTFGGYEFGSQTAGIGDFNGDGRNDFAIGFPAGGTFGNSSVEGAIYIYYGRANTDPWPATVNSTGACVADLCFVGTESFGLYGTFVEAAGDVDGDGKADLATSESLHATPNDSTIPGGTPGGRAYIMLGKAYEGASNRSGNFFGTVVKVPDDDPSGFYIDGTGVVSGNENASSAAMGQAGAAIGNIDGAPGDDLVLSSGGDPGTGPSNLGPLAKVYFLSGHAHANTGSQLQQIPYGDLTVISTGQATHYAAKLVPFHDAYNNVSTGIPDFAVINAHPEDAFQIWLGDLDNGTRFTSNTRLLAQGPSMSNFGSSISATLNPSLSANSAGDLDGDGIDDLVVATSPNSGSGAAYLFYGSTLQSKTAVGGIVDFSLGSKIDPSPASGTLGRIVQYVGDVTGDGQPDIVVSEPDANGGSGGFTILY